MNSMATYSINIETKEYKEKSLRITLMYMFSQPIDLTYVHVFTTR